MSQSNSNTNFVANPIVNKSYDADDILNCPGMHFFTEGDVNITVLDSPRAEPRYKSRRALICGPFGIVKDKGAWSVTHLPTGARICEALSQADGKKVISQLLEMKLNWNFHDIEGPEATALKVVARDFIPKFYYDGLTRYKGYSHAERVAKNLTLQDTK